MQLHGKARDIEPGLVQIADVAFKLPPGHLVGLADFAIEIRGRLVQFFQGVGQKGRIASQLAVVEIANPSGFENPESLLTVPVSAGGVNAPADFKGGRIQLEDIQASEQFMIGIEKLVVVDLRVFTKDPLPAGLVVSLRRAALDLVAEGVLALIGVGQVRVVQHQQDWPRERCRPAATAAQCGTD